VTSFKNADGKFLGVTADGDVVWGDDEQKFEMVLVDGKTALRDASGCYLSVGTDGRLHAQPGKLGSSELFALVSREGAFLCTNRFWRSGRARAKETARPRSRVEEQAKTLVIATMQNAMSSPSCCACRSGNSSLSCDAVLTRHAAAGEGAQMLGSSSQPRRRPRVRPLR
jgi:hypothetical protein